MSERELGTKWKRAGASSVLAIGLALVTGMLIGGLLYSWWSERALRNASAGAQRVGEREEHDEEIVHIGVEAQKTAGIETGPAALRSLGEALAVTGVVSPDLNRVAKIRPLARGLVDEVHVRLGDRVKKGQSLVSYDNAELGVVIGEFLRAGAELERSETDLAVKRQILARSGEMLKVGALAKTAYDIRDAEYKDAQAKVKSAQAVVSEFDEQLHRFGLESGDIQKLRDADPSDYHRTASHSVLRAPFSGVVTSFNVAEGESVNPSDELLTIISISTVWVLADVYEKDLAHVRENQDVRIRVATYPGEVFHGRITYIADAIDPATRAAKVRCVVANPSHRLKLEMFATVDIPTGNREGVLAVPAEAVQTLDGQETVFVPESETGFRKQRVDLGPHSGGWVEVLDGLAAGDMVVTAGSFYLKTAFLRELMGEGHAH